MLLYRLPCSWIRSNNFAVGGVLYFGSDGLLFVPHRLNLKRDQSIFEMGPNHQLHLTLMPTQLNRFMKMLVPRPVPRLQLTWPGGSAQFLIPAPDRTLKLIDNRLCEFRKP
jgi:hypothetical protein